MSGSRHQHVFERLELPGSPAHVALLRFALGLHLFTVFTSPALPLLARIGPELHPQARILGGASTFAVLAALPIELVAGIGAVASVSLALGLVGRLSALTVLVAFLVTQGFWFGATLFHDDWIYFTFPLLVFGMSSETTAYSIDAWRARPADDAGMRRDARWIVEAWVVWIGAVYGAAGVAKLFPLLKGVAWMRGGAALEFAIEFVRSSPFVALSHHTLVPYDRPELFMVASVLTVVVEVGALSLWFTRRTALPLALAILGMHAAIWMIGIPGFIGMFSVLGLALLPSRAFARADDFFATQVARRGAVAAATAAATDGTPPTSA